MFLQRMGIVQCFVIVSMLSTQLVLSSPVIEGTQYYTMSGRTCKMCPAGEYQKSCTECEACADGSYTTRLNREDMCHHCYGDCRPDFHLKVVQNCTRTSDVKCVCEAGFRCTEEVQYSTNCRYCVRTQETTSTDKTSSQLAAILCPVVAIGCMALVILFFVCCLGDESCFKQAIAKLCNEGGRDASYKPEESTHQFPRDSFSAKQQPSSRLAANLGPVHVHNPGTVIFSFLSQFKGQVGPTVEGGKKAERGSSEEEDERDCPVFHPTSSPSIHLSEEERSGEIFFPSQEQGKDCHVSKEEALKS
ncbi:tumor necrosis factor receptor superfamily member 5 [Enoplosus armatus]|uniref:tumor necrosis factor receptor superfamily member 5 n=1 Tax=Enoplosus armatus TaxID=215367 RepID=UPI0039962175